MTLGADPEGAALHADPEGTALHADPEGTALHAESEGPADGRSLVLAHGFTQTGRLWGEFGHALARRYRLVRLDLPGHGGSSAIIADLVSGADLLVGAADMALGGERRPFDLLGYSLGARFALHAALAHPDQVHRLVLIGCSGGIEDPEAAANRRARDVELARQLDETSDLRPFLLRWVGAPMFAGLGADRADLDERMRNSAAGLASSLRLVGAGTQAPLWDALGSLTVPTLLLAGADDPRFVAQAIRLAKTLPAATVALVPGAGHAAHLHQPALAARLVSEWLDTSSG